MRKLIRRWLINGLALAILATFMSGIDYGGDLTSLAIVAGWLTIIELVVRPLLKIVLLPINLITFGLLGWLIGVAVLYLATIFVSRFSITAFGLGPFSLVGFKIPKIVLSDFWALVTVSFSMTLTKKAFRLVL
jgi:putative membrane protein